MELETNEHTHVSRKRRRRKKHRELGLEKDETIQLYSHALKYCEEKLQAKDKELQDMIKRWCKRGRERKLRITELKKVNKQLEERLKAKDKELKETKVEHTQKEVEFKQYKQQQEDAGLKKDQTIQMLKGQFQAKEKKLQDMGLEKDETIQSLREELSQESQVKQKLQDMVLEKDETIRILRKKLHATIKQLQDMNVNKRLADSEERLRVKDKELEVTKAGKTQQERVFKQQLEDAMQELNTVNERLADSQDRLRAKDKELEETKAEKTQEQEVHKQQLEFTEEMETELTCEVCKDLFTKPVMLDCTHSFCTDCIRKSLREKKHCPVCRHKNPSQTFNLVLDKCSEKARLQRQVTERAANQEAEQTPDPVQLSPPQDDGGFDSLESPFAEMYSPSVSSVAANQEAQEVPQTPNPGPAQDDDIFLSPQSVDRPLDRNVHSVSSVVSAANLEPPQTPNPGPMTPAQYDGGFLSPQSVDSSVVDNVPSVSSVSSASENDEPRRSRLWRD